MNTYTFNPLVGVGAAIFFEKREIIRESLGKYTEFKKNRFSQNTTDDFGFCQVFYDGENLCEAVEFANGESQIVYEDIVLTELKFIEATKYMCSIDGEAMVSSDSITSKKLGISFYAPNCEVETLLFFRKGYFD